MTGRARRRAAAILLVVLPFLPGCRGPQGRGAGAPESFLAGLRADWDARIASLSTLSATIRLTVEGKDGGPSVPLLLLVKCRSRGPTRLLLLADFVTLADALLEPPRLTVYVPLLHKAYRGEGPPPRLAGAAGARSLFEAGLLRDFLDGVRTLPAGTGRVLAEPVGGDAAAWTVTVRDESGAVAETLTVRSSDHVLLRAERYEGGKVTTVAEAGEFRREGGVTRPFRQTLSDADGRGKVVLQFQTVKRNERLDPGALLQNIPEGVALGTFEDAVADQAVLQGALGGGGNPQ